MKAKNIIPLVLIAGFVGLVYHQWKTNKDRVLAMQQAQEKALASV